MKKRIIALLLILALLPALLPIQGSAAEKTYENTHENTGNQIEDLIAVALSQLGYKEGTNNDTKYGDWYKLPNQPWCAMFVSWCAYQAEISTDIIDKSAMANPKNFGLEARLGSAGAPKRGDIFFKQDFSHCGIVVSVEGSNIVTVEGNSNNDGGEDGYWACAPSARASTSAVTVSPRRSPSRQSPPTAITTTAPSAPSAPFTASLRTCWNIPFSTPSPPPSSRTPASPRDIAPTIPVRSSAPAPSLR